MMMSKTLVTKLERKACQAGAHYPILLLLASLVCLFCKVRQVELSFFFFCFNFGSVGLFPYSC